MCLWFTVCRFTFMNGVMSNEILKNNSLLLWITRMCPSYIDNVKGNLQIAAMYKHNFISVHCMLNEVCSLLMLSCRQHCLGSLCLAVFNCQAEVDLQFSLYQILSQHLQSRRTREKPWRGVREENQHIWVWLKPSKHSPSASSFFVIQPIQTSSTWKKKRYSIFSAACVICVSLDLEVHRAPAKWSASMQ